MHKLVRARSIAVLAAYVVVLQTLLLPLSVAAGVFDASLCSASAMAEGQQPAGHDGPCSCAAGCGMQSCTSMFGGLPPSYEVMVRRYASTFVVKAVFEVAARPTALGSHSARAPPSA